MKTASTIIRALLIIAFLASGIFFACGEPLAGSSSWLLDLITSKILAAISFGIVYILDAKWNLIIKFLEDINAAATMEESE